MEERLFKPGDIVQHFKRETISEEELLKDKYLYLYEILGVAKHTETEEALVVYKPLYETEFLEGFDYAARPLSMFASEVDHEKYPNIKQKYRFEKVLKKENE
jgi:hypothetical protein